MKTPISASIVALMLALSCTIALAQDKAQEKKGITSYRETIDLQADGSASVTIDLSLAGWAANSLDLPLSFAKPDNISASGDGVRAAALARNGDVRVIRVQFENQPPSAANVKIRFAARDFLDWKKARSARGTYALAYTFTNTATAQIGDYRLKLLLPEGYEMNGITSSTPRMTGEEVTPPYDFSFEGKRTVVNLRGKAVAPGRNAAIAFGFVPAERDPLPFILAGLLIAGVALWIKRDVLTREDYVREAAA